MAPPSPPAPSQPFKPPPVPQASDGQDGAVELSLFNILNIFHAHWFLNRDHLIANVLSAQKSETGQFVWVDFQPPFHTHLVQCTRALLPPICPMAKGKKVMFVFILEVLDGDRPQPGPFWEVPKKCHCRPHMLKKTSEVSLQSPLALVEEEEFAEEDAMEVVKPTSHTNSAPPPPQPHPASVPFPLCDKVATFLSLYPFPCEIDHMRIVSWFCDVRADKILPSQIPGIAACASHDSNMIRVLYAELLPRIACTFTSHYPI